MLPGSSQIDLGISHHLLIDVEASRAEVLDNKLCVCLSVFVSLSHLSFDLCFNFSNILLRGQYGCRYSLLYVTKMSRCFLKREGPGTTTC